MSNDPTSKQIARRAGVGARAGEDLGAGLDVDKGVIAGAAIQHGQPTVLHAPATDKVAPAAAYQRLGAGPARCLVRDAR